jgi:biopolymer transport protein TolR
MDMASSDGKQLRADINVTPLIDVLLVLLIIFMVIQPLTVRGLETLIPQPPNAPERVEQAKTIVVQVLGDAERGVSYKINEDSVSKGDMERRLAEIFAIRRDKVMFIKGDARLDFSLVAAVIDDGRRAGVENMGIITPRTGGVQATK